MKHVKGLKIDNVHMVCTESKNESVRKTISVLLLGIECRSFCMLSTWSITELHSVLKIISNQEAEKNGSFCFALYCFETGFAMLLRHTDTELWSQ